jgi:hypothetical protein
MEKTYVNRNSCCGRKDAFSEMFSYQCRISVSTGWRGKGGRGVPGGVTNSALKVRDWNEWVHNTNLNKNKIAFQIHGVPSRGMSFIQYSTVQYSTCCGCGGRICEQKWRKIREIPQLTKKLYNCVWRIFMARKFCTLVIFLSLIR